MTTNIVSVCNRINEIAIKDKKSVVQRALKLAEECGELCEVVNIADDADGLAYKRKNMKGTITHNIMSECADNIIVAMSIPPALGYSLHDLFEVIEEKCDKWESKISNKE